MIVDMKTVCMPLSARSIQDEERVTYEDLVLRALGRAFGLEEREVDEESADDVESELSNEVRLVTPTPVDVAHEEDPNLVHLASAELKVQASVDSALLAVILRDAVRAERPSSEPRCCAVTSRASHGLPLRSRQRQ